MARPRGMCLSCPHPRNQHSVYRDKCLIKGCTCTESGGRQFAFSIRNGES